jgi:hypothetical protein
MTKNQSIYVQNNNCYPFCTGIIRIFIFLMKLFEREHGNKNKTTQENKKRCRKVYTKNTKFRIALSETSESLILFGFSPSEFPTTRNCFGLCRRRSPKAYFDSGLPCRNFRR